MNDMILRARLFEKQMQGMQQGGGQQDADGDGLDDKTGQPIKRVTTITEDINNKTGQVASKETKTKVMNPTAEFDAQQADNRSPNGVATNLTMKSKDELINHFSIKKSNNDIEKFLPAVGAVAGAGARMAGKGLLGAAKFGLGSAVKKPAKDNQQPPNQQPPNQQPSMMDRMKGAGKVAGRVALGAATMGASEVALGAYNKLNAPQNRTQGPPQDPNNPTAAYMPVGGGVKSNLKNMATNYATGVMNTGKLTGEKGGVRGMWDTMTAGGAAREGMKNSETQRDREQYDRTNQRAVTDARYKSNSSKTDWQDPMMQVQNSYDLESKIHDLYTLQKQQSYYREIDSTEAIRFACS